MNTQAKFLASNCNDSLSETVCLEQSRTYVKVLELVAVEVAADVDAFGANDHHLLTVEDGLGHDGGQAAQQVASAVNDDGLKQDL